MNNVFLKLGAGAGALCLLAVVLAGCSARVLDFRNAEVSNGKIYSKGDNSPFNGKVTNMPLASIRINGLQPLIQILTNVTKDQSYSELFLANALATIMGRSGVGVLCDLAVSDGMPDGSVRCDVQEKQVLQLTYSKGLMSGKAALLDPRSGKPAAEAEMKSGLLEGKSTVYDAESGNMLHTVNWVSGLPEGVEQFWNKDGQLVFKANLVRGKYDGEAVQYEPGEKVKVTTLYKEGVALKNVRPGMSDFESCLEDRRVEGAQMYGPENPVPDWRKQEWRQRCEKENPAAALPVAAAQSSAGAAEGERGAACSQRPCIEVIGRTADQKYPVYKLEGDPGDLKYFAENTVWKPEELVGRMGYVEEADARARGVQCDWICKNNVGQIIGLEPGVRASTAPAAGAVKR